MRTPIILSFHGAVLLVIVALFLGKPVRAEMTVEEIQRQIVARRQQIAHGTLRIHTVIDVNTDPRIDYQRKEITFAFTFQAQEIRLDRHQVALVNGRPMTFAQRRILANNQFIYDEPNKAYLAVEIGNRADANAVSRDDLFDPRICGLVARPIVEWDRYGIEDALRTLCAQPAAVHSERLNGEDVLVVSRPRTNKGEIVGEFTTKVCPAKAYALLNVAFVSPEFSRLLNADYKQVSEDVWFPERLTYEEWSDGKLDYRETSTLEADFSRPVAPSQFTLASLMLPAGQRVRAFGRDMVWDGQKLAPNPAAGPTQGPVGGVQRWGARTLLFGNAILCALLACALLIRWFSRRALV